MFVLKCLAEWFAVSVVVALVLAQCIHTSSPRFYYSVPR